MTKHLQRNDLLDSLLTELAVYPVQAVRRCKEEYHEDDLLHSNCVASTIAFIVALTRQLTRSQSLQIEFQREQIFDEDSRLTRKLIIGVARFILGAKADDKARYERARSYAEIADHFVDQAISPAQVAELLIATKPYTFLKEIKAQAEEESGDENLFPPRRRAEIGIGTLANSEMSKRVNGDKGGTISTDIEKVDMENVRRDESNAASRPSEKHSARPKFIQETMIILEGMAFQNRVRNIGQGNAIWLKVRCERLNDNWNRFYIEDARPSDRSN